jgi:hypothetical protein
MPPGRRWPMFLFRARTDRGAGVGAVWVASVVSFTSRTRGGAEADAEGTTLTVCLPRRVDA